MFAKVIIPMLAIFLILPLIGNIAQCAPTITIEPDITIEYGDITYINGTEFTNNTSVRVDIIFPSGVTVEGVAYNVTDAAGNFSIAIALPDVDGSGYIKVICGSVIISTLVTFEGTSDYLLQVTKPSSPVVDEYSTIDIEVNGLTYRNYILKLDVISPSDVQTFSYWVLHDGECTIPYLFDEEGRYDLEITIENTTYVWSGIISVGTSDGDDGGGGSTTTNVTWNIVKAENVYTINIFKSGTGYVQSGTIRVVKPDATILDIAISAGTATFTASTKGTYQLQFTTDNILFLKSIEYSPIAVLSVDGFSETGETTITYTLDGKTPTDTVTVQVSGETTNTITLVNGVGTFTTTSVGSYTFTATHLGTTTTASATYSDTYEIEGFTITQSENTDYLYVTGRVVGVNSGDGKSNANVVIEIEEIGYRGTAKSGDSGSFRATIPLSSSDKGGFFGGNSVVATYSYGDDEGEASIKLDKDWVGDYWILWVFGIGVLLFALKEKGILHKYFKILPPRGHRKPDNGSAFDDDPFLGS